MKSVWCGVVIKKIRVHYISKYKNDQGTWGWQMRQTGPGSVGHYFVKLPESEQQVRYIADGSGYHSAVTVATSDPHHQHTTSIALGERAVALAGQIPTQIYALPNENQTSVINQQNPLEIYFLQQQIPETQFVQIVPNNQQSIIQYTPVPNFYYSNNVVSNSDYYKINNENTPHEISENIYRKSKDILIDNTKSDVSDEIIETKENGPVVVFKNHKCNNDETPTSTKAEYINEVPKSTSTIVEPPSYQYDNIHGNFGTREYKNHETINKNPPPVKEEYEYSTETNHYSTESPPAYTQDEGISRLVASTQDLISNDDLLRINHAAERAVNHYNEDVIKSRHQTNLRAIHFKSKNMHENRPRNRITVSAKVGKIINTNVEHPQTDKEPTYPTRNNEYKFTSPIVVDDSNYSGYKQQILNNFVSTMVPYIEGGYEIVDIRNSINDNNTYIDQNKSGGQLINITPRPVSQNYLAPITVALRLLNDNSTENFNTVDDHDTSDSEFIENTVNGPRKEKTVVEVQESIPVEITHINDVEYHEYLDEGRSNKNQSPLGVVKSLYQKYVQSLDSENNVLNNYNGKQILKNSEKSHNPDQEQTLDPDDNKQTQDQTQSNSDSENAYYYNTENGNKIIQPIIIEKQIPVTTYVDRFIEKQVPYPERVEVVKQVPVDRPVPVPVHYETIVEKPVEVTRYIDKPYPVGVLQPYPVEVRVPYPVEHKVYVDRPIHVPYPVEKVIEKQLIHPVPVPTPVGIPIGIPVEKRVLYPVPYETPVPVAVPIEKPVTVEKIVEKNVPVPYPVEKQVPYPVRHDVQVPVPYPVEKRIPVPVEVPRPYPVDRIVEKKVPYPVHVDRIVERKVPVQVPYPVKTFVEKVVEKPVVVTKYVNKPYPVEKRVPYPVDRIVERKVPYPVHIPYAIDKNVQKSEHPYRFENNEKLTTLYSYGVSQEALRNVANYLKYNQEQYKQPIPSYAQAIDNYNTQQLQKAESKRNYQIQLANANVLKNLQNVTPMFTTKLGNQYASSFHYLNVTEKPTNNNYINQDNFKYYGPPPLKNYDDNWEKNKEYTETSRRTDRQISNVRIEYGGFKPPLIPSTEIDLDGIPIKKNN